MPIPAKGKQGTLYHGLNALCFLAEGRPSALKQIAEHGNRVLIIGGGQGGRAMLEMFLEEKMVRVTGVVDTRSDAPAMELARASNIPVFADLDAALTACEPCLVFNLTGKDDLHRTLIDKGHIGGIVGGVESLMMWKMVTKLQEMQKALYYQAHHDPLTGAYNRRYVLDHLQQGLNEAARYDKPYAVAMLDLDHFKAVNDALGHAAGDAALQGLVQRLQECLRHADILGRWGGEEFLVLLPNMDLEHATLAVEKWLKHVSGTPLRLNDRHCKTITFSAGVAAFDPDWVQYGVERAIDRLLQCADQHLYHAKEAGRNRVVNTAPAAHS